MINKCIILSRVSTGHQDLDSQTSKVMEVAIQEGYTKENIIKIEDVESGAKLSEEERNGLNKLKQFIESDPSINCVYTYELSRISRVADIIYSIRKFLMQHNVQLVVLNPSFRMLKDDGTLNPESNIFIGIFGAMAENEGMLRKARIKKAVTKYKAEGRHTGGIIMFGYDTDSKHNYIPHKENSLILRSIFQMYVEKNMSIRAIAREMWERGIRFKTSKTGRSSTAILTMMCDINTILHRREYIGENNKPRLITDELFYKAQEIMKNKTICAFRTSNDALLRGMLYNKENNLLLSANATNKYYYSRRYKGPSISYECADMIIWDWVCSKHKQYQSMSNNKILARLEHEYAIIDKKIMEQFNRKMELLESIDRLEERIVLGKISSYKADELSDKLHKEIELLDKSYIPLQEQRIGLRVKIDNISSQSDIDIDNLSQQERIDIVHQMIKKIYIERIDRIHCRFYIESNLTEKDNDIITVDSYHKKRVE